MSIALPPKIFDPLLEPLETLPGVKAKEATLLKKACGGERIADLLFSLPTKIIERDRLFSVKELAALEEGAIVTLRVKICTIKRPAPRSRHPWRLVCADDTGKIEIFLFGWAPHHLLKQDNALTISGKIRFFNQKATISNPDHLFLSCHEKDFPWLEPVWPLTAGLNASTVSKALRAALKLTRNIPEWHDRSLLIKRKWPSFHKSLEILHHPDSLTQKADRNQFYERALERLQADEILAHQMCVSMAQFYAMRRKGQSIAGNGQLQKAFLKNFGHEPTHDQKQAIQEISKALSASYPMQHLLQGDVGSGKTLVAFAAILTTIESGKQAAIMAPTEILAHQHFQFALKFSPVKPLLLTGKITAEKRREALSLIKSGKAQFIIGTHALFQKNVIFNKLGLAIIDEQHRFGVEQRIALSKKNDGVNLLLMSATPIPRSIQLTRWGQMGVSRLLERPAGRGKITTTLHNIENGLDAVKQSLKRAIEKGKKIYWVCPAVKESQFSAAAEERYEDLKHFLGQNNIGLAHGKQSREEQEKSLFEFRDGNIKLLISTTLIEVGLDVPDASIMIIEDAQRFGLAQLHQLRGRIGRGALDSYCLLLYRPTDSSTGIERLSLLRKSLDGFHIAEADYQQRGGGEITGIRQSGLPAFKLSQTTIPDHLITQSSQEADLILAKDPKLTTERGDAVRGLMYLFEKTSPETVLSSG